jgi:thiol-disulfide isomerase/thioredoxin
MRPAVVAAPRLEVGHAFPPFMLDFLVSGHDHAPFPKEKHLIVNVWASWCGPCRREMPGLEHLSRVLEGARFAVLGMSIDADAMLASEFLVRSGVSFANVLDQGGVMARRLGLHTYPETFVIAPDGILLARMTGLREWDSAAMRAQLEALSQGRQWPAPLGAGAV